MSYDKICEAVFRRLIKEGINDAPNTKDLACAYEKGVHNSWAFVYRTNRGEVSRDNLRDVGVAFIQIVKPEWDCADAWEVVLVAGDGKYAYGMGYALAPSGILMPDRQLVSKPARAAWLGQYQAGRESIDLDDYQAPKTPPVWDDCKVYKNDPEKFILNRAYTASGWEIDAFEDMTSRWDPTQVSLRRAKSLGNELFHDLYPNR